jgi:hypothetical protein
MIFLLNDFPICRFGHFMVSWYTGKKQGASKFHKNSNFYNKTARNNSGAGAYRAHTGYILRGFEYPGGILAPLAARQALPR